MFKNVASQKWVVFAFDTTDGTAKTGDAAQITAKISLDHAAAGAITDTNPTEVEDGYYTFDLTQGETDADHLLILPESSTGDIQVIGVPGTIQTSPQYFGDMGIESDGDLTKVNTLDGHTAQTADHTAGIADVPTVAEFNARTLAAAAYFDPAADTVADVTAVSGAVGSVTGAVGSVTGNVGGDVQGNVDGSVASVTADVTTDAASRTASKADVSGLATSAALSTHDGKLDTAQADLDTLTGADGATLATLQGNYAPSKAGDLMGLANDAITSAKYDESTAFPVKSADAGATEMARTGADGDTLETLSDEIAAQNDLSAAEVNAEVVDALATDTYAEPGQGAPGATVSLAAKIGFLYKFLRNKIVQDATTLEVYDDAGTTVDQKATVSDDGTDYTRGEIGTGP